jgi:hypothetical protein
VASKGASLNLLFHRDWTRKGGTLGVVLQRQTSNTEPAGLSVAHTKENMTAEFAFQARLSQN